MIIDSEGRKFKIYNIKSMLEELHIAGVGPEDISMVINAIKKDEETRRQFICIRVKTKQTKLDNMEE